MQDDSIKNGAFLVARKIFESEVWTSKPATWVKLWIYIIGHVNHKDSSTFKRGEGYFNFTAESRGIGNDITPDIVKKFLQYGRRTQILSTKRSTRGIIIKVLNYDKYQTISTYISTMPSTTEARVKHERSTPINKYAYMHEWKKENIPKPKASDDAPMTLDDFLKETRGNPRRDIRLIGEYADEKKLAFTTKGQWSSFLRRNLRVAGQLAPFDDKQIAAAFSVMQSERDRMVRRGNVYEWGMETILKYVIKTNT